MTITLLKTDTTDFWATIVIAIDATTKTIDGGSKVTSYSVTETTTVNKGEKVFCSTTEKKKMAKGFTREMTTEVAMRIASDRCSEMGYVVA
jgi:hypothetical protein